LKVVVFSYQILYIGISPKEDTIVENTKNAVSIEVLMNILEREVESAWESMKRTQTLLDFEMSYENGNKKTISFFKKMLVKETNKWSALFQNLFIVKSELGIK
jgi:hypothetical protein